MEGLTLRGARPEDAADFAEIAAQPSVVRGTMQLPAQSPAQWRKRLETLDPETNLLLVAEIAGRVVGTVGLHGHPRARLRHAATLGMMVHEAWQGRGIGARLLDAALEAADQWLGLTRIELEVFPDNERAVRLYERRGFEHEGRKRAAVFREGGLADVLVMARLRPPPAGRG